MPALSPELETWLTARSDDEKTAILGYLFGTSVRKASGKPLIIVDSPDLEIRVAGSSHSTSWNDEESLRVLDERDRDDAKTVAIDGK
jgi:hypothetical protein